MRGLFTPACQSSTPWQELQGPHLICSPQQKHFPMICTRAEDVLLPPGLLGGSRLEDDSDLSHCVTFRQFLGCPVQEAYRGPSAIPCLPPEDRRTLQDSTRPSPPRAHSASQLHAQLHWERAQYDSQSVNSSPCSSCLCDCRQRTHPL